MQKDLTQEKLNWIFENIKKDSVNLIDKSNHVTNEQYEKKIDDIKNKKIKDSLLELSKVFKEK